MEELLNGELRDTQEEHAQRIQLLEEQLHEAETELEDLLRADDEAWRREQPAYRKGGTFSRINDIRSMQLIIRGIHQQLSHERGER
jgi:hypothetical protein